MGMAAAVCWGVWDGASAEERDWLSAHTALKRLARERAAADAEEGRCLLSALRAGVHEHLGYGSFAEYVERLLGYSSRATREKVRVAEALEGLPLLARALEHGTLSWCAVRELTRVATAETEAAWLERAHGKTTRELEQLVASKRPGDLPPRPGEAPPPRRHVLRFEVSPETFAIFKQATESLRRAAGGGLDASRNGGSAVRRMPGQAPRGLRPGSGQPHDGHAQRQARTRGARTAADVRSGSAQGWALGFARHLSEYLPRMSASSRAGRRRFLIESGALGASLPLGALGCTKQSPRIDAHQHFWSYGADNYSWIDPASVVARDFMPAELEPQLRASGIDGTVAVEARSQVDETEDLLGFARKHRFVRGVVGWLPLVDASVGDLIDRYASDSKLRGLRHAIAAEPDPDFMLREDFNRGIARLRHAGRRGLRFDLLLVPASLSRAPAFVDRHPQQIFILDHFAKPRIKDGLLEPWASELRELARRPNVYCKVSGLVTEANLTSWTPGDLRPYLDVAVEAFTPRRLLFGSDWPMCLLATTYDGWLSTVRDWVSALSSDEQNRILGETAIEAYGL